ncbi:MAG: GNAT family N-acetyltransferase [Paracoccaceae bacterium]
MTAPAPRRALPDDVPAIAGVINGWIDATDWLPRVHSAAEIEGFIRTAFDLREIWVVGDPVEGYVSVDPETARVGALFCRRTGAGLGKALLDAAKAGRDRLVLHTHDPNQAARRFYAREGFVETGTHVPEPPDTVLEIVMEWQR